MDTEQTSLSFEQVLGVLRRRAPWILLCFVLVAAAAFGFSKHETKKYTATATLVFNNSQISQEVAGLPVGLGGSPQAQQNTNLKLVKLGDMAEKTASKLGEGLTKKKVDQSLSVTAETESNIVEVSATATSPMLAAEIANTYTKVFVGEQQNSNHAYYASALALVNKQLGSMSQKQKLSTAGVALENRAQSLGVLAELQSGTVQVAQAAAIPTAPSSPKTSRNTALGALLGLLLGLCIAFLLERADRRIREPKDLEAIYRLPLLGVIPESGALSRARGQSREASGSLPAGETEAFHLIRAHLRYFNIDRELRTLLVVSAAPGDGKTTIARHLAAAAARMGSRVLLLETDLRRPTLAQQLDVKSGPGVSDVLIGAIPLDKATQPVVLDPLSRNGGRALDVLVAGATVPPNPGEMVESHAMEDLLEEAKSIYDLIVIDTPPLTAVSDAFPLLRKVDGVVIVGRVGRNRRDVAERLHETLSGAGAPLLGVIANGFKAGRFDSYAYSYTYDYSTAAAKQSESLDDDQDPASEAASNGNASVTDPDAGLSADAPTET